LQRSAVSEIHVGLATAVQSPMLVRNPRVSLGKAPGISPRASSGRKRPRTETCNRANARKRAG
jgi:hypothetical protein